ncbi:MAG TPA: transglutaminase-like cysteine peptidase [Beijerinckiaceae bacterium]|jgi:predicted transglutaminase-like cysteine proteinase
MTKNLMLGAVLAFATAFAAPAAAQITTASLPTTSSVMPTGSASPIPAWAAFCRSYPAECAVDSREAALIELTPRAWNSIVSVNRRVNASVRPLTDQEHWGVTDRWDLAETGSGDCEDYQLLKRKLLTEAGLPRRAMRMTVVIDEKGEGHAVLMLRTDRGDFILDNKTSTVLPWHQTGYVYVKREGQEGQAWVSLGGATSPSATANR